jgi:hypothetical protein
MADPMKRRMSDPAVTESAVDIKLVYYIFFPIVDEEMNHPVIGHGPTILS